MYVEITRFTVKQLIGIITGKLAEPGIEVIIGTKIDDQFGSVIMFGLGGIMVEVLKDVAFRVLLPGLFCLLLFFIL